MDSVKTLYNHKVLRVIIITIIGSLLLTLSAKIKIPFYPVPMTMQTFVVLFIGIAFGWKLGIATIALYLFEGAIGLPVFSGTPEQGVGLIYLMGPTFGYLIGFLVTVFLAGLFSYNNNIFKNFAKLTLATSFIYLLGVFWLGSLIGWEKPLYKLGVQPFLLAELFKLLLITIIVSKVQKIRKII